MSSLKIFEDKQVRSHWDEAQERWYFSIVDVITILTESPNPRKYWSVLKTRLKAEGSQVATNCSQLKMKSADGKILQNRYFSYKPLTLKDKNDQRTNSNKNYLF